MRHLPEFVGGLPGNVLVFLHSIIEEKLKIWYEMQAKMDTEPPTDPSEDENLSEIRAELSEAKTVEDLQKLSTRTALLTKQSEQIGRYTHEVVADQIADLETLLGLVRERNRRAIVEFLLDAKKEHEEMADRMDPIIELMSAPRKEIEGRKMAYRSEAEFLGLLARIVEAGNFDE